MSGNRQKIESTKRGVIVIVDLSIVCVNLFVVVYTEIVCVGNVNGCAGSLYLWTSPLYILVSIPKHGTID